MDHAKSAGPASTISDLAVPVWGIIGLAAAYLAYRWTSSIALAVYVFGMAGYLIGTADLLTKPHRLQRALDLALFPAASVAVVVLAYQAWKVMWVAAIVSVIAGWIVAEGLGRVLVPKVHAEQPYSLAAILRSQRETAMVSGRRGGGGE